MAKSEPFILGLKFLDETAMANAVANAIEFKHRTPIDINSEKCKRGRDGDYFRFQIQVNSRYTLSVIVEKSNPSNGNLDLGVFDSELDGELTSEFFDHGDTVDINNTVSMVADLYGEIIKASKIKSKKGNVISVQFNSPKKELFDYIDTLTLKPTEKEESFGEVEVTLVSSKTIIMTHSRKETEKLQRYFMRQHGLSVIDDLSLLYEFVNPMPETMFDTMFEDMKFKCIMRVKPSQGSLTPEIEKKRYSDFTKYVATNYLADQGTLSEIDMRNLR